MSNPFAYRTVLIKGHSIPYTVQYSARSRRIALKINHEHKLALVLPKGVPEETGTNFLHSRLPWLEKHIEKLIPRDFVYMYLGREHKLVHTHNRSDSKYSVKMEDDILYIDSPFAATAKPREIFMMYLHARGKTYLPNRCMQLSKITGREPVRISIRGQVSRWGSCSRRGTISLNFKLMQMRPELIDYVIVHELCHLWHLNHSRAFWHEVKKHIPHYKALDREINSYRP